MQLTILPFACPLISPLKLKQSVLRYRQGHYIYFQDSSDAIGEISPFPGLSAEGQTQVAHELQALQIWLKNKDLYSVKAAFQEGKIPVSLSPSVEFGLGMLLYPIRATKTSQTLKINALFLNQADPYAQIKKAYTKGFRTFKIKVGFQSGLENDIALIKQITEQYGDRLALRLDANRSWSLATTQEFMSCINTSSIEYLEEPFKKSAKHPTHFPLALDETLQELSFDRVNGLFKNDLPSALILKPMILGWQKTRKLLRWGQEKKLKTVISGSFESPLGWRYLCLLAQQCAPNEVHGLDTLKVYDLKLNQEMIPSAAVQLEKLLLNRFQNLDI